MCQITRGHVDVRPFHLQELEAVAQFSWGFAAPAKQWFRNSTEAAQSPGQHVIV